MRTTKAFTKERWRKGAGEVIGFSVSLVLVIGVFLLILGCYFLDNKLTVINDSARDIARKLVVCESIEEARTLAQSKAEEKLSTIPGISNINTFVEYTVGGAETWAKGNFITLYLYVDINNVTPLTSGTRETTVSMMIERNSEEINARRSASMETVIGVNASSIMENALSTANWITQNSDMQYGHSASIPPCSDNNVDEDSFIACVLYNFATFHNIPTGGLSSSGGNNSSMDTFLTTYGFKKTTAATDIHHGSIVMLRTGTQIKSYLIASYNQVAKTAQVVTFENQSDVEGRTSYSKTKTIDASKIVGIYNLQQLGD